MFINAKYSSKFNSCPNSPNIPADRRSDKDKLRLGTFNLNFLFQKNIGPLDCPGKSCNWKNKYDVNFHFKNIANAIKMINVDILVLTEVEDCDALNELIHIIDDDTYKPYLIKGTDSRTGQQVGLITRVDPIKNLQFDNSRYHLEDINSKCEKPKSFKNYLWGSNKHLQAQFNIEGLQNPLTLIGLHLSSRPDDKMRCFFREAEALVISKMVDNAISENESVVVMGDFNDFSHEVADISNNKPISNVLKIIQEPGDLLNVGHHIKDQNQRFSHYWAKKKSKSLLDHILISPNLNEAVSNVKIGNDFYDVSNKYASDHFPYYVEINILQAVQPKNNKKKRKSEDIQKYFKSSNKRTKPL